MNEKTPCLMPACKYSKPLIWKNHLEKNPKTLTECKPFYYKILLQVLKNVIFHIKVENTTCF